ncbi:GNAT family N-acetyltransferase [Roseibium sp. CAU 1637]|uniref:GNAT family N-acetyltransferase n=1 Tax=Roseibium limicola TaxID=2816037 RepID=A0A939ENT0_9HYPH|nr:GNAT family N-acetyltransferase [Roseibium limicola]
MIGVIVLRELHDALRIGYWQGEPFWGRGFKSEALGATLCWLFEVTDVSSVRAEVLQGRPALPSWRRNSGFPWLEKALP